MSLIDRVLEVGMSFDWITPLDGLIRDLLNGPRYTFVIDQGSTGAAHRVLKERRAKVWGMMIAEAHFIFTCRLADAPPLWLALERAGVVILNANPPALVRRPARQPARQPSLLDRLDRWVGF